MKDAESRCPLCNRQPATAGEWNWVRGEWQRGEPSCSHCDLPQRLWPFLRLTFGAIAAVDEWQELMQSQQDRIDPICAFCDAAHGDKHESWCPLEKMVSTLCECERLKSVTLSGAADIDRAIGAITDENGSQ